MSIGVMDKVFKHYPNGGGEMLLALALAGLESLTKRMEAAARRFDREAVSVCRKARVAPEKRVMRPRTPCAFI